MFPPLKHVGGASHSYSIVDYKNRPMVAHTESNLSCTLLCICAGLSCRKNLLNAVANRIARVDPSHLKLGPKQVWNRRRRPRQKPRLLRARKPMLRGMQKQGPQSGLRSELSLFGEEPFFWVCVKIPWNSQERELGSSKATRCRCWVRNLIKLLWSLSGC